MFKSAAVVSVFEAQGVSQDILMNDDASKIVPAVYNAAADLDAVDGQLYQAARGISDTATRVVGAVETGSHLNSLGELQSRGADFDRLIAVRAERIGALKILLAVLQGGTMTDEKILDRVAKLLRLAERARHT